MSHIHIYTIAIIQGHLLSWPKSHIQNLLRNYYDTLKTIDEIDSIIQANKSSIAAYEQKITSGNAKIHQRIKLFAKQNNLNAKFETKLSANQGLIISRLISIIQCFHKISYESLESTYKYEFNSNDNVIQIMPNLEIYRYENNNNQFTRVNNSYTDDTPIKQIQIKEEIYKIIYDKTIPLHINDSNKEIVLHDNYTSIKFLYNCLKLQEIKSDPDLNAFIKEVRERL